MTDDLGRLVNACLLPIAPAAATGKWVCREVAAGLAGAVVLPPPDEDSGNLEQFIAELRGCGDVLIAADEEGGDVTAVEHATGSSYPGSLALGAIDDPELTANVARDMAGRLVSVGVNLDLAPSLDINGEGEDAVIGARAFGLITYDTLWSRVVKSARTGPLNHRRFLESDKADRRKGVLEAISQGF